MECCENSSDIHIDIAKGAIADVRPHRTNIRKVTFLFILLYKKSASILLCDINLGIIAPQSDAGIIKRR